MKKILSIVAVAAMMLFAGKANAQLSVHAGYQSYTISADISGYGSSSASDDGFYAGLTYDYQAGAGLGVAPGIYFAYVENIVDIRVPILLNYGIKMDQIGLGAFAGPQVTIGLAGDAYDDSSVGAMTRFDLGLTFGAFLTYEKLSFELGYNMGLLNRLDSAPSGWTYKTNQFFAGIGYAL